MKLEDIIPPLELCKKIPEGEFKDSAFVWLNIQYVTIHWKVVTRNISRYKMERNKKAFPAPTLQEIMSAMPHCRVYKKTNGSFIAVHEKIRITHMDGATAAMKLWFKNKGIEE